jgi:hypothetical protein
MALVQPARIARGCGQPVKAPAGGWLIERFPRPLDDHQHPAGGLDPDPHLADVRDMVQRRERHHRVGQPGGLIALEPDRVAAAPFRHLRIDAAASYSPRHVEAGKALPPGVIAGEGP